MLLVQNIHNTQLYSVQPRKQLYCVNMFAAACILVYVLYVTYCFIAKY